MDILTSVDTWFLIVAVTVLGGFFLWAVKYIFDGVKTSIDDLDNSVKESTREMKQLIQELFIHRNDHEKRLTMLETRCEMHHGEYDNARNSGGRRWYDPARPPAVGGTP